MNIPRGPVSFMFVDVAGSTDLVSLLTQDDHTRLMERFDREIVGAIERQGGYAQPRTGDEIFGIFQAQGEALEAATEIMRILRDDPTTYSDRNDKPHRLYVRIGIGAASTDYDPEAGGHIDINRTHRIAEMAVGEQILVTNAARTRLADPAFGTWETHEGLRIRNHQGPQRIHELIWDGRARGLRALGFIPEGLRPAQKSYIGCEEVIEEIAQWAEEGVQPMFLLWGRGGIGKTSTAVQAVLRIWERFEGGVKFVRFDQLATLNAEETKAEHLAAMIADAIRAPEDVKKGGPDALVEYLGFLPATLLVLDNLESVANEGTNAYIGRMLGNTAVRAIGTSQRQAAPQGVTRERSQRSLVIPNTEDEIATSEAFRLFNDRACLRGVPDLSDRAALLRVLRATEGLPLAVELLASHALDATLQEIADGVERAQLAWVRTTAGDAHAGEDRHQSLEGCVGWSIDRLPKKQAEAIIKLAPFDYPFTRDDAQAIAGIAAEWLTDWFRWSLLKRYSQEGISVYEVPSTVRLVLAKRAGSNNPTSRRYDHYYTQLVREHGTAPCGSKEWRILGRSWRPAYRAMVEKRIQPGIVLQCSYSLAQYLIVVGHHAEAKVFLEMVLSMALSMGRTVAQGNALQLLGDAACYRTDYALACDRYDEALALYRDLGERKGEANTLQAQGDLARLRSDYALASARFDEALALYRNLGDRQGEANVLQSQGDMAVLRSDYALASARFDEALALCRDLGDRQGEANCLVGLVWVHLREQSLDEAETFLSECKDLIDVEENKWMATQMRQAQAVLNGKRGQPGAAAELKNVRSQFVEQSNVYDEGQVCLDLGELEPSPVQKGQAYRDALDLFTRIENAHLMGESHLRLSRLAVDAATRDEHLAAALALWSSRPDLAILLPRLEE